MRTVGGIALRGHKRRLSAPRAAALGVACLLAAAALACLALPPPASASVARGLCEFQTDYHTLTPEEQAARVSEVTDDLRARWVRLVVQWPSFEPERGAYSATALQRFDELVDALRARGVRIVATVCYTPRWASDTRFWDDPDYPPPTGSQPGYRQYYPPKAGAEDDLQTFMAMLSSRYAGRIEAYECWNEPNLWPYIYPQRTAGDRHFSANVYLRLLRGFSAGVRAGDPLATVVAGSTGPIGEAGSRYRTPPEDFARHLKALDAARHFDVYSHHPYTPGGTRNAAPDGKPNNTSTTITLYNISTLLRLFPGKPFYLTEYGYNTSPSKVFGGMSVSMVKQADYLRQAYRVADRHPQIKMLLWFLVRDVRTAGNDPSDGVFTGLRTLDDRRKLSWFAFAGGNTVSIVAPRRVRPSRAATIRGVITNRVVGPVNGRAVRLQSRRLGGGAWRTVSSRDSDSLGRVRFLVKPGGSRRYRLVWAGVKASRTAKVFVF